MSISLFLIIKLSIEFEFVSSNSSLPGIRILYLLVSFKISTIALPIPLDDTVTNTFFYSFSFTLQYLIYLSTSTSFLSILFTIDL